MVLFVVSRSVNLSCCWLFFAEVRELWNRLPSFRRPIGWTSILVVLTFWISHSFGINFILKLIGIIMVGWGTCGTKNTKLSKMPVSESLLVWNRLPRTKTAVFGQSMWATDENLGSYRPSHGQIRTLDQAYNIRWTYGPFFLPWTVHLMDELGRWTKMIRPKWTNFWSWTVHLMDGIRQ